MDYNCAVLVFPTQHKITRCQDYLCHSKVFRFRASHRTIRMNHDEFQENYIGSIKMELSRCCFFFFFFDREAVRPLLSLCVQHSSSIIFMVPDPRQFFLSVILSSYCRLSNAKCLQITEG